MSHSLDLVQMAAFIKSRGVEMVFGKNSPLKGEGVQCLLTYGAVSKQKLWFVAIRVVAGDLPFTPEIMERSEWKG